MTRKPKSRIAKRAAEKTEITFLPEHNLHVFERRDERPRPNGGRDIIEIRERKKKKKMFFRAV